MAEPAPHGAPPTFAGAVEGPVDEAVLRRVLLDFGIGLDPVYLANGKTNLLRQLPGYNNAARHSPWVVLVDLDHSADCAPPARAAWLPVCAPLMCFRIAIRAVEAWLLADREAAARYLGVRVSQVPVDPEGLADPKQTLVDLARRSTRRRVREAIVPREGSGRQVGPGYTQYVIRYVHEAWQPGDAEALSESLRRFRRLLATNTPAGPDPEGMTPS